MADGGHDPRDVAAQQHRPYTDASPQQNAQAASAAAATVKQYCVGCHSAALKTGGVVLDPATIDQPANNAETWERAIKQLRAKSMPPVPMPRPDAATYDRVASYLETELDRAAAAKPNPGDLPNLHRLTRTEYRNAIRDLLALDNLPKEMDYTLLLPADNASSGFDNIADLLYVSPATMERYLDASTKISRLAVGDPAMPLMVNIYRLPLEEPSGFAGGGSAVRNARRDRHSQLFPPGRRVRNQSRAGRPRRAIRTSSKSPWTGSGRNS